MVRLSLAETGSGRSYLVCWAFNLRSDEVWLGLWMRSCVDKSVDNDPRPVGSVVAHQGSRETPARVVTNLCGMACTRCGARTEAIARFCPGCGARLTGGLPHEERNRVSIIFVDQVGSTARADGADPEDVEPESCVFYEEVRGRIERHGGMLEKYAGDAVIAVFGVPLARSNDAESAVRAGLSVLEGIRQLNASNDELDLEVRIGICTGEAVVEIDAPPESASPLVTREHGGTSGVIRPAWSIGRRTGDLSADEACLPIPSSPRLRRRERGNPFQPGSSKVLPPPLFLPKRASRS